MKKGANANSGAQRAIAAAVLLFPAIPFPPGLSSAVAEEADAIPSFTERERDVGGWVAEGKRDAEIASILEIGVETVKTYVKNILQKTGVENRGAFIAWVWRHRLAAQLQQILQHKNVTYA